MQSFSLLEPCELFVKEVNDHRAEYKAGENCKKSSNAYSKKQKNGFYCHCMELAGPKTHHYCYLPYIFNKVRYMLPKMYLDPSCLKFWNWKQIQTMAMQRVMVRMMMSLLKICCVKRRKYPFLMLDQLIKININIHFERGYVRVQCLE